MTPRQGSADVIVVGAGIIGAACAESLTRDGRRVLVLDRGFMGGGATAAAMGHLVVMDDSPAQLALTSHGVGVWNAVREELPPAAEWLSSGTLWIAEDETQLELARVKREVYRAVGVAAELLSGGELAELEPNLRPDLAGVLRVPHDAVLYPPAAARWLMDKASARGAELREGVSVMSIAPHAVQTSHGELQADVIILSGGASVTELVPELPVLPRRGHLIVTDRYPRFCTHQLVELGYLASAHTLHGASVAFNVQPRGTGQMLIGSSRELAGWDAAPNRDIVRQMVDRAIHFMPSLTGVSVLRVWTGFRPATPDALPLIGPWPALEGVWIAAGHEGLGITTSLATAQLIADLLAGRPPALDPHPYAPDRSRVGDVRQAAHA